MAERSPEPKIDDGSKTGPSDETRVHEEVRYDSTQVSIVGIAIVLIGIAVTFGLAGLVSQWFVHANADSHANQAEGRESYSSPSGPLPPEPRLEPLGLDAAAGELPENIAARQLRMERILHSYGRTSDERFVRIPIELAIKAAATRLPAPPATPEQLDRSFGLVGGGESSSGRNYQEAPSWFAPAQ